MYNESHIDRFRGQYYFLSNFYLCNFVFDGIPYTNAEAAFQAQKSMDIEIRESFSKLNPKDARYAGRKVALRPDWEQVKYELMKDILLVKFSIPELKEKLLSTGDVYIEEGNSFGDTDWGTVNGVGQNNLGKILMSIREDIKKGL